MWPSHRCACSVTWSACPRVSLGVHGDMGNNCQENWHARIEVHFACCPVLKIFSHKCTITSIFSLSICTQWQLQGPKGFGLLPISTRLALDSWFLILFLSFHHGLISMSRAMLVYKFDLILIRIIKNLHFEMNYWLFSKFHHFRTIGVVGVDAPLDQIENILARYHWGQVSWFIFSKNLETIYHPHLSSAVFIFII